MKSIKIIDCEIIREDGRYMITHNGKIVHTDWYSEDYDWLGSAMTSIRSMSEKYHTIEMLTLLRIALREDSVQGWNEQEDMIWDFIDENEKLTKSQFDLFIREARRNDKRHHGVYTF